MKRIVILAIILILIAKEPYKFDFYIPFHLDNKNQISIDKTFIPEKYISTKIHKRSYKYLTRRKQ